MVAPDTYLCSGCRKIIFKGTQYTFTKDNRIRQFYHAACDPFNKQPTNKKTIKEKHVSNARDSKLKRVAELLELLQENAPLDRVQIQKIVDEAIQKYTIPQRLVVEVPGLPEYDTSQQHYLFSILLYRLAAREDLYLHGPSGTGKTQAFINAANVLRMPFAIMSLSPQSPPSRIEGFIDAHGKFTCPEFYKLYTTGGLMIFDELDFGGDNFMNTLNSAVSNGFASFPNGTAARSPDFILCGTGNTDMRGGNLLYPNRRQLCTSVVSRLRMIEWPPDQGLEMSVAKSIAGDKGEQWCRWVQTVRSFVHEAQSGIRGAVYADFRAIIKGCEDIYRHPEWLTIEQMCDELVFKGLPQDQKSKILFKNPTPKGLF